MMSGMPVMNEEKIRAFIYDNDDRKYSDLKREHIMYMEREAMFLKHKKGIVTADKLDLIKMIFWLTEENEKLTKENNPSN